MTPPNPGSDEALSQGCRCPVLDNAHGRGSMYGEGTFWVNALCPLHGHRRPAPDTESQEGNDAD